MLNEPYCHQSLAEPMLLDIYTVMREASQIKTNNAFSALVIKLSRFSSHLTILRVASNCISKYASKQTRQTRIEFTFRESPLSAHCPHVTIGKSATHQFVDTFYFRSDSLTFLQRLQSGYRWLEVSTKNFCTYSNSKKKSLEEKGKQNKQFDSVGPFHLIIDSSASSYKIFAEPSVT